MAVRTYTEASTRLVEIPIGTRKLNGFLDLRPETTGIVVFAHGSDSGRFSTRNRFVACALQEMGLGTLLLDLLDEEEAVDREKVFDVPLLAERLLGVTRWLRQEMLTRNLRIGLFGASTGAGAALMAAALQPGEVKAVVVRGLAHLARDHLPAVQAPTLLIVGGADHTVLRLNQQALRLLRCSKELVVVPRATHLFSEPGTLEEVAHLAQDWFLDHLSASKSLGRELVLGQQQVIPAAQSETLF